MSILELFFIIHVLFVLALLIVRILKILKFEYLMLVIALLLPIWGPMALLTKEISDRRRDRKNLDIEVARMRVEDVMKNVYIDERNNEVVPLNEALIMNDNSYRQDMMRDILYDVNSSIMIDSDDVFEKVVPLNEALIINDAATRRVLVKDVLYSNPSDYVAQLAEAKRNDDTEVVHYAVTALVEMQKDFDIKFQDIFMRREANPDDEAVLREYMSLLERYIASGLLEGDGLQTQLREYRDLLLDGIDKGNRNWTLQCKLADTDMQLKDKENFKRDVEEMRMRWPERDSTYLYRIRLGVLTENAQEIKNVIEELKIRDTYLSPELRSALQFWSSNYEENFG